MNLADEAYGTNGAGPMEESSIAEDGVSWMVVVTRLRHNMRPELAIMCHSMPHEIMTFSIVTEFDVDFLTM